MAVLLHVFVGYGWLHKNNFLSISKFVQLRPNTIQILNDLSAFISEFMYGYLL